MKFKILYEDLEVNYKEEITKALDDNTNKNHEGIMTIIFNNIPSANYVDLFEFCCKTASNFDIKGNGIGKFITDAIMREDDQEVLTDEDNAEDILNLTKLGEAVKTIDFKVFARKYPNSFSDIPKLLFSELAKDEKDGIECAKKLLDKISNNLQKKIYDECVKNEFITEEETEEELPNEETEITEEEVAEENSKEVTQEEN